MRSTRTLLQQTSRTYFSPTTHTWYRVTSALRGSGQQAPVVPWATCQVQVGLTRHGLDHIGDITKITRTIDGRSVVHAGEEVLKIEWDGFARTECDELYHSVWDSIEGEHSVTSPIAGTITDVFDDTHVDIDEDTVLVLLHCDGKPEDVVANAGTEWLDHRQYEARIKQQELGIFSEVS